MIKHSNRNIPVERWPESLDILRQLAIEPEPMSIRDVARQVSAPEISTRNRLAKLEAHGTVRATRLVSMVAPGKQVVCTHYAITQYGRDCAQTDYQGQSPFRRICANSVFNWASSFGNPAA